MSMAASLDQWLIDRLYYNAGADIAFRPYVEQQLFSEGTGAAWMPPNSEFEALPGVVKATRVGDYVIEIRMPNNRFEGRFIGIDRLDFPSVASFRSDFGPEPLGSLMNRLALGPDHVLVSQDFLAEHNLNIGDRLNIFVLVDVGATIDDQFIIAGTYQYFPTVYEEETAIVGNLDYLFGFFGLNMPHNMWLKTDGEVPGKTTISAVPSLGIQTIDRKDTYFNISEEQAKMERVGVFGTLSVSFLAAAVMAALGLLTYSYASLQERIFQFALLHALGLKRLQIIGQVFMEYSILTAYGAIAGVIGGTYAAVLFIPLFQITGEVGMPLPPMLPLIAQEEVIPLAVAFAGTMILLELFVIAGAIYRRLFAVLRMGHQ